MFKYKHGIKLLLSNINVLLIAKNLDELPFMFIKMNDCNHIFTVGKVRSA